MIRILGSLLLFPLFLMASMNVSVDKLHVTYGEQVNLRIGITGSSFKEPTFTQLCGVPVLGRSSSTSLVGNNGVFTKSYQLAFSFAPVKDCEIAPIELIVDGKTERSEPIAITVGAPQKSDVNGDYVLTLKSSKTKLTMNEPFVMTLLFKRRIGAPMDDYKFFKPEFKDFWVKHTSKVKQFRQGNYEVSKIEFILAPKKVGTLQTDRAKMSIGTRSSQRRGWGDFFAQLNWKNYYSNALELNVSELPDGIDIVGNLELNATVDKRSIEANSAVNVTVSIDGVGNVEDIEPFSLQVDDASVFKEEPTFSNALVNHAIKSHWKQKITVVAHHDFTIPALHLRYFNTKTQQIETLSTPPIPINVIGSTAVQDDTPVVVKHAGSNEENTTATPPVLPKGTTSIALIIIVATIAFIAGVLMTLLVQKRVYFTSNQAEKREIASDYHALLSQLLPYVQQSAEVQSVVDALEQHLYAGAPLAISKRHIKELVKKYRSK